LGFKKLAYLMYFQGIGENRQFYLQKIGENRTKIVIITLTPVSFGPDFQAQEKSRADAAFYKILRQAEANKLLFTSEYLELKRYESLSSNQKIYFGPDIPHTFVTTASEAASARCRFY
jgi:hypothetical protein